MEGSLEDTRLSLGLRPLRTLKSTIQIHGSSLLHTSQFISLSLGRQLMLVARMTGALLLDKTILSISGFVIRQISIDLAALL